MRRCEVVGYRGTRLDGLRRSRFHRRWLGHAALIDSTTSAYPVAINDRGVVVGTLDNNGASFMYDNGVLTRLEQIPEVRAAGWERVIPADINDHGWITGWGWRVGCTKNESFLLIPR